jgi:predicted glycosyltransferase
MKSKSDNRGLLVMMYSHDGFGLGHFKRNFSIACRGVREFPNSTFLLISGSPSLPFFHIPRGIDYIKLPSIVKVKNGKWDSRTLSIKRRKFRELRATLIHDSVLIFKPDIFLVDYTPTGVWNELVPILQMLKTCKNRPKIILGLRDILDAPEVTRMLWKQEGIYDVIKMYYDRVLIYGCRDFFDTANHYGLNDGIAEKVKYCGYLAPQHHASSEWLLRKEPQGKTEKRILVIAGGGYDAYPMMRLSIDALRNVYKKTSARAIFITGPLMKPEEQNLIKQRAEGLPFRIMKSGDTLDYLRSSDLIITMGGYNTLIDSLSFRKNIIVIPRKGPSKEQRIRAELFSKSGFITALNPPDETSPSELSDIILERLHNPRTSGFSLAMDGLNRVIREIECIVSEEPRDSFTSGEPKLTHHKYGA